MTVASPPSRPMPFAAGDAMPAVDVAKAALRRLAAERLAPTPENYARAFRRESGLLPGLTFLPGDPPEDADRPAAGADADDDVSAEVWGRVAGDLTQALREALPTLDGSARELVGELDALDARLRSEGATADVAEAMQSACGRAMRVLQHRHHLFDSLERLCHELTSSMAELSEDESWVRGQCDAMRSTIDDGLTARGVRSVRDMLSTARARHRQVKGERKDARDALKALIGEMLEELGELGVRTGDFHANVGRYADVIEQSDSLESLTGVVREMVEESRTVQDVVRQTQARLQAEHAKATSLADRVTQLEDEMRRLSDEVSTDQLTQVANRRGLMQAFAMERSRFERGGGPLSIGLIDIDNFKRLNDDLGHTAGDEALKALAAVVRRTLRPTDHVARFGGEEFVVLLPATGIDDGQAILTRLQRSLSGGLFLHKDQPVLVTFSAGVTAYRLGEAIEPALERADQALYEAKRTGKNRTCVG